MSVFLSRGQDQKDCGSRLGQAKIFKTSFQQKKLGWWYMPVILATLGTINRSQGPGWPGQKVRPYLKNNQRKVVQVMSACLGALKPWSPEFKSQYHPSKKKTKWNKITPPSIQPTNQTTTPKKGLRELPCSFHQVRTIRRYHIWVRKYILTSHQVCWCLDLRLPDSRNVRNKFLSFIIYPG
jgi:hypothetical protein